MRQCADCGSRIEEGGQWPHGRCAPCGESAAWFPEEAWNPWDWASGL